MDVKIFERSTLNSDSWTLDALLAKTFGVGHSLPAVAGTFDVFFLQESEGCLVALAVFKTVVAAQAAG
ncbi:MAG TPA: hypothetical protein VHU16_07470 [Candidatus Udaeobacter sp.]|nr:hypothetical protein [Candidatus Udaeobacter sp.]